jgi:predicted CXXCH cytochrome family protein
VLRAMGLLLVMSLTAVVACQRQMSGSLGAAEASRSAAKGPRNSNVARADYVGSEACAGCHRAVFDAWQRSPMHHMTRELATADVAAPFDGRSLKLGQDVAKLETRQQLRFMALSGAAGSSLFRVTKVIGGRYREDFVGEEVNPAEPTGKARDEQRVLPLSFLKFDGTLRYKGYSVMVRERDALEAGLVWQRACILCHNTAPQFVALYDELFGPGAQGYQGSASNESPDDKAFKYVIDDAAGLRDELTRELHLLGAEGSLPENARHALDVAISNTRERFSESALVELGVGCESCHGGSRRHAEDPAHVKASFAVQSSFMHVETAQGGVPTHAQDVNRSCAKCHTVLFSQYPFTWEGGERRHAPGGSTTNSGEARDFLLGHCSAAMDCTTCHDPHGEDQKSHLDELGTIAGNRVCTSCHQQLATAAALRGHSHHAPDGEGSACLNCHMPKKNMGLAYEFTRYHRIGSPTDTERVLGDRPLDCALCHADRSVDQIVSTMEKWWGKRYDRAALQRLYGADLHANPVRVTLLGGKPHEQALAADIAVRQNLAGTTDAIMAILNDPYPLVRYFARHSLEQRFGTPISLDMNQKGPALVQAAKTWVAANGREGKN